MNFTQSTFILVLIILVLVTQISSDELSFNDTEIYHVVTIGCKRKSLYYLPSFLSSFIRNQSKKKIFMHIFGDDELISAINNTLCLNNIRNEIYNIKLHNILDYHHLNSKILKFSEATYACASLKLDMINLLPLYDKVLVIDIDTYIEEDLANLWNYFYVEPMNTYYMYFTGETSVETYTRSWYWKNQNIKQHFYYPMGVNTGVILMNLELMRKLNISGQYLLQFNNEGSQFADQDILNTWTYYNRNLTYILPCKWNKRGYSGCNDGNNTEYYQFHSGIFHGNMNSFHWVSRIPKVKGASLVLNSLHAILLMYRNDFLNLCPINESVLHYIPN